jgi:hypothetical protein
MGNSEAKEMPTPPAKKEEKNLLNELEKLSNIQISSEELTNMSISSQGSNLATDILLLAFSHEKPLFINANEKAKAAEFIEKSLPFIEKAFSVFNRNMEMTLRQCSQKLHSGLQYIIDEFKDDEKVYGKLKPIFENVHLQALKKILI